MAGLSDSLVYALAALGGMVVTLFAAVMTHLSRRNSTIAEREASVMSAQNQLLETLQGQIRRLKQELEAKEAEIAELETRLSLAEIQIAEMQPAAPRSS